MGNRNKIRLWHPGKVDSEIVPEMSVTEMLRDKC